MGGGKEGRNTIGREERREGRRAGEKEGER